MNNYRGQVYVIIMFVSSLQTFIILGVCKCIKPPVVLHGVPQCQLRLLKIHNISWKPNTQEKYKTPIYSSQCYPLLHCRRGVRSLFGYDINWKFIQKYCQTHLQVIITGGLVACNCVADAEFGGAGVLVVEFVSAGVCPST